MTNKENYNKGKKNNFMARHDEFKHKYPERIFLYRTGDFYVCYKDDAVDVSQILKIGFSRTTDGDEIVSFDFSKLYTYLPKIIRANRMVAIMDAMDDETAKRYASIKRSVEKKL